MRKLLLVLGLFLTACTAKAVDNWPVTYYNPEVSLQKYGATSPSFVYTSDGVLSVTTIRATNVTGTFNPGGTSSQYVLGNGALASLPVAIGSGGTGSNISTPTTGKLLQSNGTVFVASTATWPTAAASARIVAGNGTNYVETTVSNLLDNGIAGGGVQGNLLMRDGSAWNILGDVATGNALISGGVSTVFSWGKIGLATHVSGTLADGSLSANVPLKDTAATISGLYSFTTTPAGTAVGQGSIYVNPATNGGAAGNTLLNASVGGVSKFNITAAGTTTAAGVLKAGGYQSSDASPGITYTATIVGLTSLTFKDGLLVSHDP